MNFHKFLTAGLYDAYGRWVKNQGAVRDAGFAAWPLGLESLRMAGGDPREVSRDGLTEVLTGRPQGTSVLLGRPRFNRDSGVGFGTLCRLSAVPGHALWHWTGGS
jgi:hypothetical protein